MPNWKLTIDVVEQWDSLKELEGDARYNEVTFFPLRDALVAKLRVYRNLADRLDNSGEFEIIVDNLAEVEDIDEMDEVWSNLYDWADEYRAWIKTF
jgi:hypothetical protein